MKRFANAATSSCDDEIEDPKLHSMLVETVQQVKGSDPAHGQWDVAGRETTLWVDASSIALGPL